MKDILIHDKEKDKLKRVTVNVTARDIINGLAAECYRCPVALALNRLLKKPYRAKVGSATVMYESITNSGNVYGPMMPLITSDFIRAFDANRNPLPFKFKMNIPKMVLRHP